jgi:hypothetical protein
VLRRWYEVFLVIPIWQGWRILPVLVRLHKSGLLNLDRVFAQVTYEPVAYLADTMSEYMMVRFINQAKSSIKQGDAAQVCWRSSSRTFTSIRKIRSNKLPSGFWI